MPQMTVTKHGKTKKGSPVVYFNNKHSYTDMVFLGRDTEAPPVGALIDADLGSKPREDGSLIYFLNDWGLVPNQALKAAAAAGLNGNAPGPAPYTEPERMFLSNILAAGVNAGTIKTVDDLLKWSKGSLNALRKAASTDPSDPDNDIDF